MDYADQRFYSSTAGRFLSIDSVPMNLKEPESFNRYAYAANDPVNLKDSDGMAPTSVSFDGGGYGCVSTGLVPTGGAIDASNACPPGMTIGYDRGGGAVYLARG